MEDKNDFLQKSTNLLNYKDFKCIKESEYHNIIQDYKKKMDDAYIKRDVELHPELPNPLSYGQ